MKFIVSRYNHDTEWLKDYTGDVVMYDRSEEPLEGSIVVPNIGTDIYDKFTYIIDNYNNLPDYAVYTKANLFKYISKEEFKIKEEFTPLLTQHHQVKDGVSYYRDGMYYEVNDLWYLPNPTEKELELMKFLEMDKHEYMPFAPGSNYIVPRKNILKHPKEFYEKLKSYLEDDVYPREAWVIERNLYLIWN